MRHFLTINKLRLLTLFGLMACMGSMQAQDDLQAYINHISKQARAAGRASNDVTIVDLSQFSAVVRTTTLDVANGRSFRFINGTLSRDVSLDGPVIHIGGSSYVEIGEGATITTEGSPSSREVIYMDGGELVVDAGGSVASPQNNSAIGYGAPWMAPSAVGVGMNNSVWMISGKNTFQTNNDSYVFGTVFCEENNANLIYSGGTLKSSNGLNYQTASNLVFKALAGSKLNVRLMSKAAVVDFEDKIPSQVEITAPLKVSNDAVVKATGAWVGTRSQWQDIIKWTGNAKYMLVGDVKKGVIKLSYDDLQDFINDPDDKDKHCGCSEEDPYTIEVPCEGVTAKKNVEFPEDDLYWFINGQPEGETDAEMEEDCDKTVYQGENDIYVKPGAHVNIRWIHWWGCGCANKHIWVWGTLHISWRVYFIYYWRFIHVMPGGRVVIDDLYGECDETVFHMEGGEITYNGGKCTGGKYGWYCTGGLFYLRGGEIGGGTAGGWTGKDATIYHYYGTVHGCVHNYGIHYFYDGVCTGGGTYAIYNYKGGTFYYYGGSCSDGDKIWNEGDLYIDGSGNIHCGEIYCVSGCHIYIIKKLIINLYFIIDEANIILNEPIVLGGNGYKLTQADCEKIQITLPDGYAWKYDAATGGIIVYSTSGISSVDTDCPTVESTYDPAGRKVDGSRHGMNILRMNDGTVRKVTRK